MTPPSNPKILINSFHLNVPISAKVCGLQTDRPIKSLFKGLIIQFGKFLEPWQSEVQNLPPISAHCSSLSDTQR